MITSTYYIAGTVGDHEAHVYIAGPMRGYPAYNFKAFEKAQYVVRDHAAHFASGEVEVFNPALNDIERSHLWDMLDAPEATNWAKAGQWLLDNPQEFDLRASLGEDLAWIAEKATDLVLLDGWEKSKGARAEYALAVALGLQIWRLHDGELYSFIDPSVLREQLAEVDLSGVSLDIRAFNDSLVEGFFDDGVPDPAGWWSEARLSGEVRTTSSTGGQKGVKPEQYQSIPPEAERELAEHYAKGAAKYGDHNFRKGYEWSKSYSALRRHLRAFWGGEDIDPETGSKHIIAVAWHALTLATFMDEHPDFDDRYKP